jgi:hypothetical protein
MKNQTKMAKAPKENEVAVISSTVTAAEMLKIIALKKQDIQEILDSNYVAGEELQINGMTIKLRECKEVSTLIRAAGAIVLSAKMYEEGLNALNYQKEVPVFKHSGYSAEAWLKDIKLRLEITANAEKIAKIKELEEEARTFMTKEDQKVLWLEKLKNV